MEWFMFCVLTLAHQVFGQDLPCPVPLSVHISDVDVTFDEENTFTHSDGLQRGCICNLRRCFRKCCPADEVLNEEEGCVPNPGLTFNVTFYEGTEVSAETKLEHFHILYGISCSSEKSDSLSLLPNESAVRLHTNGSLFVELEEKLYNLEDYCLDIIDNETAPVLCYPRKPEDVEEEQEIYAYGMILSTPFLFATFLVYALLPEAHSLHRKALMAYVLALLFAYVTLVIPKLRTYIPVVPCLLLGYSIIFFFMVSFVWMNVMCIDMWLAFRGLKGFSDRRTAERKRFILYNIYALAVPMLDVLIVFLLNTYGDKESSMHPGISEKRCFLKNGLPSFLYFYLPMSVFMVINCTLFIITGMKIYKAKREAKVLKHTDSKKHLYEDDKKQFKLYIKLFFAMGINWVAELISFAAKALSKNYPPEISYITDFINAAYGFIIFFIFVFKWKIWRSLKKRYYIFIGKPGLAHDLSVTRATRVSRVSSSSKKSDISMIQLENADGRKYFEPKQK